jgi:hypothetical protein
MRKAKAQFALCQTPYSGLTSAFPLFLFSASVYFPPDNANIRRVKQTMLGLTSASPLSSVFRQSDIPQDIVNIGRVERTRSSPFAKLLPILALILKDIGNVKRSAVRLMPTSLLLVKDIGHAKRSEVCPTLTSFRC